VSYLCESSTQNKPPRLATTLGATVPTLLPLPTQNEREAAYARHQTITRSRMLNSESTSEPALFAIHSLRVSLQGSHLTGPPLLCHCLLISPDFPIAASEKRLTACHGPNLHQGPKLRLAHRSTLILLEEMWKCCSPPVSASCFR
jgi:hypothetical protein